MFSFIQPQSQLLQLGRRDPICLIYLVSIHCSAAPEDSIMGTDDKFKLFCWVLGTPVPFSVGVEKDKNVDDLKSKINKKMKRENPHHELDLWQVSLRSCRELIRSLRSGS